MLLTTALQETTETIVYEIVPEAQQPLVLWLVGLGFGLWAFYNPTKPFFDNIRNNKQVAAIGENALTTEQVQEAVNTALVSKRKIEIQAKIKEWEYKALYATTDEAKQFISNEIAELKAELSTL